MTEYHGEFDIEVGKHSPELPMEIAVRMARRLPKIFEPIDFDIDEFDRKEVADQKVKDGNLVAIRFKFNPLFEQEYHSANGIDFDNIGDVKYLPNNAAKALLGKFPEAFEMVTDDITKDVKDEKSSAIAPEIPETNEEVTEENPTLDEQILELLKEGPFSFDEINKRIDIPFNQLRGRVISLGKNKQIEKDDDEKWVIMK